MFFRACTGNNYELTVDHEEAQEVPKMITEEKDGTIWDLASDKSWAGLMDMTQDLKVEIVSWGSDRGD